MTSKTTLSMHRWAMQDRTEDDLALVADSCVTCGALPYEWEMGQESDPDACPDCGALHLGTQKRYAYTGIEDADISF